MITRNDWIGLGVSIVIVAIMGFLALHGPFHDINKPPVVVASRFPTLKVVMLDDKKTIGKYVPLVIKVHVGQPILFTNPSSADHTVTAANGSFNSGNIPVNGSWTFRPKKAGTYVYGCIYHPLMLAKMIVVPAA